MYLVFNESLVVPAISVTIFCSFPISLLIIEDFPTFGLPITANFGAISTSILISSSKCLTKASNSSPVPDPLIEATGIKSPNPRL